MVEGIWQGSVLEEEMYMRLKQETEVSDSANRLLAGFI